MENKPKISNVEWGLVIGALFTIDLVQIVLDLVAVGVVINRFIDVIVGMTLALYLQLRGQSLVNPKRLIALLGTFGLEMVPVADGLPLWGLDGIINFIISKGDKVVSKIPGGKAVTSAVTGKLDKSS